jgi:hypothetical protein
MLFRIKDTESYQVLQQVIACVREEFALVATPELDDLWYNACARIALVNSRRQEQMRLEHDQAYSKWIDVGEGFGAALDVATLAPALTEALLSRYTDAKQEECECIVALRDGVPYTQAQPHFVARALVPPGSFPRERRVTFLAFPLAYHACNLGVAVFEMRACAHQHCTHASKC